MAAPNSIFSSSSSEQRWVNQITETLNPEKEDTIIDIDDICIFQLPKTLTSINPEAFAPRRLGLGPYHHLRPDLHKMERKKLAVAKRILRASPVGDAQKLLIQEIKESELLIRGFYDQYIDLDGDTIAWIFAIDGLFLFDHLNSHYGRYRNTNIGPIGEAERKAAQDIMMLENQIPLFFLFKLMGKFIRLEPDNSFVDPYDDTEKVGEIEFLDDTEIGFLLYDFVAEHSPLYLCVKGFFKPNTNIVHLLDYMYHLIVNNRGRRAVKIAASGIVNVIEDGKKIASAAEQVLGLAGVSQDVMKPFKLIQNLPWQDILDLFKKSDQTKSSPSVEEIVIPSASQLWSIAGINFSKTIGGIRDIKFVEENRTMYLPEIRLYVDSEVILRNLIAYEASMGFKSFEVAEYVDLMCGIVDTVEDVKLLREKGIIHEDGLSNEEIAKLFNGIRKSSSNGNLEKMIKEVNEEYENKARVKAYRSLKKYGYASWKVLTFMATVVLVLLLILQSICQIYGCSTRFFGYQQTLSLAYADA